MKKSVKNLIIVTGASNVIGKEFMRYYSYNENNLVLGISRKPCDYGFASTREILCDLLSHDDIDKTLLSVISATELSLLENVYLLHSAGKAKNELLGLTPIVDLNNDGLDDEMYAAQLDTFDNLYASVTNFFKQNALYDTTKFTLVGMGSLIDKFNSPIHTSMREINNIMRNKLKKISQEEKNHHTIMLSLSTVATATEKIYRKFADQTYRLSGSDVVDKSIGTIHTRKNTYEDIPIYKYHPLYESYFKQETIDQRIERFKREIGLV